MLNEVPQLLLADRFAPITDEVVFIDLPFLEARSAYVEWRRWAYSKHADVLLTDIHGNLDEILHALEPLRTIEANRTALVPTANNWTAIFENRDSGPDLISTARVMAKRTGRQTIMISVALTELDGIERKVPSLDAIQLVMNGPINRLLAAAIDDSYRWVWHAEGPIQPFERPERYRSRRIKDRLTVQMLGEYTSWFGLQPFHADFYAPNRHACLVEIRWNRATPAFDVSLEQVQARLARGWHNPSSYEGII
jgi:hypothetical protein